MEMSLEISHKAHAHDQSSLVESCFGTFSDKEIKSPLEMPCVRKFIWGFPDPGRSISAFQSGTMNINFNSLCTSVS